MKRQLQLGLIAEGSSITSAVLRLPNLADELGPVKTAALRSARRLSNLLHAGYPVSGYKDLAAARLVLMRVPDSAVPRIVEELCDSSLVLKNLSFVLCESWLASDVLEPLQARGASVATLVAVPCSGKNCFAVEGQTGAVRQIRRILDHNAARTWELRPGTKPLYFAAELLAMAVPLPLFLPAQQALRITGISGTHLHIALEEMAREMLKDLSKGGRVSWGGPLNECSAATANRYLEILRHDYPAIADVLDEQLAWALRRMSRTRRSTRALLDTARNGYILTRGAASP